MISLIVVLATSVILVNCITAITRMDGNTNHSIRLAYVLISAGAFAESAAVLFSSHKPEFAEVLILCGMGLMCVVDRRAAVRCPFDRQVGRLTISRAKSDSSGK